MASRPLINAEGMSARSNLASLTLVSTGLGNLQIFSKGMGREEKQPVEGSTFPILEVFPLTSNPWPPFLSLEAHENTLLQSPALHSWTGSSSCPDLKTPSYS